MSHESAFDPAAFRSLGHRLVDRLADHLEQSQGRDVPVLEPAEPGALLASWRERGELDAPPGGSAEERILATVDAVLSHANRLHHPGYVGHQVSVPLPAAALVEMACALLNNGMAVYEMGQLSTILERLTVEWLGRALGFEAGAGGVLTHGGSVGNLTALLAARQARAGYDVWTEGQRGPASVLVSEQAHYCVARSVQCMGWGQEGAWAVPVDGGFRLDPEALPSSLAAARAAGRQVVAVVASACSTATGSFDPIDAIADFCEREGLWLHVDGAHGASLALSARHRHRLAGIERADSVVWDLHKLMALPALNTAVLFREGRRSHEAFAQEAGYLFQEVDPEEQWFNLGQRTLECTKRGMGVTAYALISGLGAAWFEEHVDRLMALAETFAAQLDAAEDFELLCPPEANILCFRHRPQADLSAQALDAHQAARREAVIAAGGFYLVQTRIAGALWLRVTLMNSETTAADLEGLLEALRGGERAAANLSG